MSAYQTHFGNNEPITEYIPEHIRSLVSWMDCPARYLQQREKKKHAYGYFTGFHIINKQKTSLEVAPDTNKGLYDEKNISTDDFIQCMDWYICTGAT